MVDIQPGGRGKKRYRKTFATKAEAQRYERTLQAKLIQNAQYVVPKADNRTLIDLIDQWWQVTGILLSSGADTNQRLKSACKAMGNPLVIQFTASTFAAYRVKRIEAGLSPATLNRELHTFKAMFSELSRLGYWPTDNPLQQLRPVKHHQPKMAFLTVEQIGQLMGALKQTGCDAYLVSLVCLSTGARWGEAQTLTITDFSPGQVHFHDTKSKKSRSVPISKELQQSLVAVLSARSFNDSYSTFSRRLSELGFNLPKGQRSHVLRHTFASYFMMNGGNILTLQKVLGHSSLEMTMKYAHLAPEYLQEVLEKNPALTLR
ncbi:MAG: tyrosine-type recombinase/integrase [Methylovulum sp.]|nr:tyrosine-type recombinase/integrase [Methylovulum sp.]